VDVLLGDAVDVALGTSRPMELRSMIKNATMPKITAVAIPRTSFFKNASPVPDIHGLTHVTETEVLNRQILVNQSH
jgi:hypothetical protein